MAPHPTICELLRNRQTLQAHEAIDIEKQMLIASVDLAQESLSESTMAHVPITESLTSGDAPRSVAAMEPHLQATWVRVRTVYEQAGRDAVPRTAPKLAWDGGGQRPEPLQMSQR